MGRSGRPVAGAMGARNKTRPRFGPETRSGPSPGKVPKRIIIAGALALLLLLALSSPLGAQNVTRLAGVVLDVEDGSPVSGAEVILVRTSIGTITDAAGRFTFANLPEGQYRLTVRCEGYLDAKETGVDIVGDITRYLRINLSKRLYRVTDIIVEGKRIVPRLGPVTTIDRTAIDRLQPHDLSELLETVEGVYVERTGSVGGEARIRIRGSDPKHVLVLVDGHRINAGGSGIADLGAIPLEIIEEVEIHRGGASARFGPDALAGVVNIVTQQKVLAGPTSVALEGVRGRWQTRQNSFVLKNPLRIRSLAGKFAFSERDSDGDFDYTYSVAPENVLHSGTRVNNNFSSSSYYGSAIFAPRKRLTLRSSLQVYNSENGLPGWASEQNFTAGKEDDRTLFDVNGEFEFAEEHRVRVRLGYTSLDQAFTDLEAVVSDRYDTRYTNEIYDLGVTLSHELWQANGLEWGVALQRDKVDHRDLLRELYSTGETVRKTRSFFVRDEQAFDLRRSGLVDRASVDLSLRYDHAATKPESSGRVFPWDPVREEVTTEQWSPRAGFSITKGDQLRAIVRGSWGKSFRLPGMNALFWKGDVRASGNPDLRPERSEHRELGFELAAVGSWVDVAGGMTFYRNDVTDQVAWAMGYGGVWTPYNLGLVRMTGHEDFVTLSVFNGMFEVSYRNTITDAVNKVPGHNSYDRKVTYTPHYVTTFGVRAEYRFLFASYASRRVGRRYALEGNEKWYDAYRLDDVRAGIKFSVAEKWHFRLDWRLDNVLDEDYTLISHIPMPGRNHSINWSVAYGLGRAGS